MQEKTPSAGDAPEVFRQQIKLPDKPVCNLISSRSQFPNGLVGDIAQFIFDASPRPVREIALVGGIGLFAGITGRAYNVSRTGLNQYILLVARTGRGKEAIASGISQLMKAVKSSAPAAMCFEGPTEIASPQALLKWLMREPCIYSIVGEFGIKLQEMSASKASPNISGLKRAYLDLYQKSGNHNVLGAMAYANRDENTPVVKSPAFTLIGESTPDTLYENVNEGLILNGLLSRFSVIEYAGILNEKQSASTDALYAAEIEGAKNLFSSKSGIYKALNAAEAIYNAITLANSVARVAASIFETTTKVTGVGLVAGAQTTGAGVETAATDQSVTNAGTQASAWGVTAIAKAIASLPFPLDILAGAAVAAVLVGFGVAISGGGGSSGPAVDDALNGGTTAKTRQATQGAGTVLGDATAQSASIANSLDQLSKDANTDLEYSNQMVISLKAIQGSIGKVGR